MPFHYRKRLVQAVERVSLQGCWQVLSPTRKETSYSDRRFWFSYYPVYNYNWRNIYIYIYIYIYITWLPWNEIFSPSNKIRREVGRAKYLSAPLFFLKVANISRWETLWHFFFWTRNYNILKQIFMTSWTTVLSLQETKHHVICKPRP